MIAWVVDVIGFLLLCIGSRMAIPRTFRLICRIALAYVSIFAICYYLWLRPQFQYFSDHPHYSQSGIAMAFNFQGFWHLLGNMLLVQAIFPVGVVMIIYFAIKWLSAGWVFNDRR